jgi:hypothetical protein
MIRKGNAESALRHVLLNCAAVQTNGEFVESRLHLFRHMTTELLLRDHRSRLGAHSLQAIYWSRFNTMYHLMMDQYHFGPHEYEFKRFLAKQSTYIGEFKKHIVKERQKLMGMSETEVATKDIYAEALKSHFKSRLMAQQFLALESKLLTQVENPTLSNIRHLRDKFNNYNRMSFHYIQHATAPDIRNLSKTSDRIGSFCWIYRTPLMIMVTTTIPIQWYYAQLPTLKKKEL